MDKNHIKIDDLFRNRLSGGEEQERPGAWLAMRELLDAEMPVQAAFNWRRVLGFITVIAVATSVSVGGYRYYAHRNLAGNAANSPETAMISGKEISGIKRSATIASSSTNTSNTSTSTSNTSTSTSSAANTGNTSNTAPLNSSTDATINNTTRNIPLTENTTAASTARPKHTRSGHHIAGVNTPANTADTNTGNSNTDNNSSDNSTNRTTNATTNTAGTAHNHTVAPGGTAMNTAAGRHHAATHGPSTPEADNNEATASATTQPVAAATRTRHATRPGAIGHGQAAHTRQNETPANEKVFAGSFNRNNVGQGVVVPGSGLTAANNSSKPKVSTSGNSNTPATKVSNDQTAFVLHKDTIQQIEIVFRKMMNPLTQKVQYFPDTVSRNKYVVERLVPIANRSAEIMPAASLDAASADNNLVSLSRFKVSSKFHNAWVNNAARVNQLVKNVEFTMARAQFYAGITGGFNANMFGANSLAGFQLGITGLLAFNERWSIGAELKFYQRFNTGASIQDNYTKGYDYIPGSIGTQNGQQVQSWSWKEDRVTHYYNFTAVQTLEAPIALRYNIGRIFGEAGVNLMYAFAINAEEIERTDGAAVPMAKSIPVGNTPENINGGRPQVNLSDFGSRFGLGYVLGAGYQFSPALNTNFRLVQGFWDNAGANGAQRVSRSLYQMPSLQLSIGYRFSQNRNIRPQVAP